MILIGPKPIAGVIDFAPGIVALRLRWDNHKVTKRAARAQALRIAAEVEDKSGQETWIVKVPATVEPVDRIWLGCCVDIELASDSQASHARAILEEVAREVSPR